MSLVFRLYLELSGFLGSRNKEPMAVSNMEKNKDFTTAESFFFPSKLGSLMLKSESLRQFCGSSV